MPPALFLPISREKWGPPPGRRGNGALRPEAASVPPTHRVRSTVLPLAGGPGLDRRRLAPATWVPARSRAGDPGFL